MDSNWHKRIDAVFSHADGSFSISDNSSKTNFLRLSKIGFNTLLIKVVIKKKAKLPLTLRLGFSH
jgi:hypothetical protein